MLVQQVQYKLTPPWLTCVQAGKTRRTHEVLLSHGCSLPRGKLICAMYAWERLCYYNRALTVQTYRNDHYCLCYISCRHDSVHSSNIAMHGIMSGQSMQHTGIQNYAASEHHMAMASCCMGNQSSYLQCFCACWPGWGDRLGGPGAAGTAVAVLTVKSQGG